MKKRTYIKNLSIYLIVFSLIYVLAFSGSYISGIINERNYLISKGKSNLTDLSDVISIQTENYFSKIKLFFQISDFWLESHPGADPRTDKDFLNIVNTFRKNTDNKIDIRLVSKTGGLFYIPSKTLKPLADVSDRWYYKAQLSPDTKGFYIADPVLSRVTGKWGIPISYPLSSKNADIAVIFAAIEIPNLNTAFEPFRIKPNGSIMLIREDGMILAKSPHNDKVLGTILAKEEFGQGSVTKSAFRIETYKNSEAKDVQQMISYRKIEGFPLSIEVTSDVKDLLGLWYNELPRRTILITMFLIIAFLMVFILLTLIKKLKKAMDEITCLSITDPLTNLFNRRYINDRLSEEINRTKRYGYSFSLIMLDIDYFKTLNDEYGHDIGDTILREIADLLKENTRNTDFVSRWGGEEFIILCEASDLRNTLTIAEKLRAIIEKKSFGIAMNITCSFGVTEYRETDMVETILKRVDEAMYISKNEGRNKVTTVE
jgi:diguanylate cyclase (GGDEF)-like protein